MAYIIGFSNDGGVTVRKDFSSLEGATASSSLYGRITADIRGVPDGGSTAALLGLAGLAIGAIRRRCVPSV